MSTPLAETLRPKALNELVGQEAATGKDGLIRNLLNASHNSGFFPSLIFWGPPGCGKTTLARIIAQELGREFHEFSAVNTSVKDIEQVIPRPTGQQLQLAPPPRPVIFLDEIHRFNKSQQDALLPHVERGTITLLGATTENPSFSVIHALLSRCRVVTLQSLSEEELSQIVERGATFLKYTLDPEARDFLTAASNGDARVALNVLEIAGSLSQGKRLGIKLLEQALQKRQLGFDKGGEEFYNTISAFHKSIRGSDPDAALYWLARMLEAGQDPLYISRRLIRMASEDIGLADPQALLIATAAHQTCAAIGMPECNLALAEAAVYLAKAPKSNAIYTAYSAAAEDVHKHGNLPVPLHIRNAPTALMKELGYGKEYRYAHSAEGQKDPQVDYLPDTLRGRRYLDPQSPA